MNEEDSQPIECRGAVELTDSTKNELKFMPAGLQSINPVSGGIDRPINIRVDRATADAIEKQRAILAGKGKRCYFDFDHQDGPASFWPDVFLWREGKGVIATGEWTRRGKAAVEGKEYRAFSPVFHVDNKRGDPALVVCKENAAPNFGGLVNDPAFKDLPLWAKHAGTTPEPAGASSEQQTKGETEMNPEEIAALRAKHQELETKVENLTAIVAQNAEDEPAKLKLTAAESEMKLAALEIETAELKAKAAVLAETINKHNRAEADAKVKAAVLRGAILAKDLVTQEKWRVQITADPATFGPMLDVIPGNGKGLRERYTSPVYAGGGQVSIVNEDPINVYGKMAKLLQSSARATTHEEKARIAVDVGSIYAGAFKEIDKNAETRTRLINSRLDVVQEAIMAADVTDANLGTIAGTLVTQRTLELLKFKFPALVRFTTDFSDQPATYNQTIMTRIVSIPSVVTYSTATGWADVVATTTDVPVTINNHKGVPITFNENLLASTMRKLFDEFAEASAYALAKAMVDALYTNLTDANYTNNSVSTSAAFTRNAVVDIGTALEQRGVPLGLGARTMLLWPTAFGSVKKDATMIQFGTNVPQPSIITEGTQPDSTLGITVDSFQLYSAPNMPSNNANLIGFAGSKSALCIATRTPNDYTSVLPGASFGNVQMVTDPDISITVMQVQYVNHTLGTATSRIALMWGTAPGQTAAGQLIKAAAGSGSSR